MNAFKSFLGWMILSAALLYLGSCDSRKNPFSAKNVPPAITDFAFKPDPSLQNIESDSLKYKAGESYPLHLEYEDPEFADTETGVMEARFQFLNGSGTISHEKFQPISADGLTFKVPGKFSGDLLFVPDTSGRVRLKLQISDGVKDSGESIASAFFFENLPPIPFFTVRALTQVNPYRIEFDPANSVDRDGQIKKFIWSFGDNSAPDTVLTNSVIVHEYEFAGQYRVRLQAIDDEGKTDTFERLVTTNNQAPVAALRITPQSGKAPLEVDYNAGGSFDPDGNIASYQISFDDGETAQNVFGKHTYAQDGTYRVLLTVRDNLGLADTTVRVVEVSTPPIAKLKVEPKQGKFPLSVMIDASESRDPFGGTLLYEIFIDGQLRYTQSKVTHIFDEPKTSAYLIRLEVESSRTGRRSSANEAVFVTNTPPIADFTFSPKNPQPTVVITFTSTSFDPDSTDAITNYRWIWGDGQEDSGANLRSITHSYNVSRKYLVTLVVTDRFDGTAKKETEIEVK